ncbi:OmcA/MtrC family decaheme c-type cytochrome [Shewanella sp. AS1]|uniref:OmcA/MtrC family decaheme c-type cytochrome n=1 Tax=Shewanella sp. AS1 TaxID=2907626 RepID=UPI002DD44AC0|nr:OmcA/MtrC family decaheme c-type cytochrome [Shewanella sp. AS1]
MKVQNNKFALLLAAGAVSIALSGCGGSDGKDGEPGNPGGPAAQEINTLNLDITKVAYTDGVPTVTVFATNEQDLPVIGLQDLGLVAAQLTPMGATGPGNSATWTRTARTSEYTDNKDGSYSFTFDVADLDQNLTQRFNVYAGGKTSTLLDGVTSVPRREIVEDFDGEGNAPTYTKDIVSHETCTACHAEDEPLTRRHSGYYTQETCATCHSGSMDTEKQWNHLIHNIHNTAKSFTDRYGNDYTGQSAEHLIQNDCKTCHVQNDELTEWGNWSRVPTMEVCSSCHVGIDFKAGKGHSQQNDNANCIACHNASWTESIHTDKAVQKKALIDQYGINVESVIDASTQAATISIAVVDAAGNAVDINTILPQVHRFEVVTNVGPNKVTLGYGGKDSVDAIKNGVVNAAAKIDSGKLVYTTTKPLNLGAAGDDDETAFTFVGWAMCSADGAFADCDPAMATGDTDNYTGMKAGLAYATLSGQDPSMRHVDSVAFSACANCHTPEFEVHKGHHAGFVLSEQVSHATDAEGNAIIGVDACVACHTPDGTYAGGANKGALEMKLHVVHGQQGIIKDCTQCHNDFNLDSFQNKGALATSAGFYTTPITATCTSCHDSDTVKAHAASQGAVIDGDKVVADDAAQLETCFFCHAPIIEDHTKMKM